MTKEKVLKRLEILGKQKNSFFKEILSTNWAFCSDDQFAIILYSNALEEDADIIQRLRETVPVVPAVKNYLYNLIMNALNGELTYTPEGYISIVEEMFLAYIRLSDNQLLAIKEAAQNLDKQIANNPTLENFWENRETSFEKEFSRLYEIPEIKVSRIFEFIPEENEKLYEETRTKIDIYFDASSTIFCDPFPWYKPAITSVEGFVVNLFKYDFGSPFFKELMSKYRLSYEKLFIEIFNDEDCCTASFVPFHLFEKEFSHFLGIHPEVICNLYNQLLFADDVTTFEEICRKLESKYNYDIESFYKTELASGIYHDVRITTLFKMIHFAPMHAFETLINHTSNISKYDLHMFVNRINAMGNMDFRTHIVLSSSSKELVSQKIQYIARKDIAYQFDLAIIRRYTDLIGF